MKTLFALLLCTLFLITVNHVQAQQCSNYGTEFLISFPTNYSDPAASSLYIRLTLISPYQTTARIWIGSTLKHTLSLKPNTPVTRDFTPSEAQVVVQSNSAVPPLDGIYTNQAIRVESDAPLALYGINRTSYTSDGLMCHPVHALGTEYIVATAPDNVTGIGTYRTPAQYLIIGAFNGTAVTVRNVDSTMGHGAGSTFTVTLNKGDVFSAMTAKMSGDLTGTYISSTKPVAVVAGNDCSFLPDSRYRACDHLCEMLRPISQWGASYLAIPYAKRLKGDMFRIVAGADNTSITINGVSVGVLPTKGGVEGQGWMTYLPPSGTPPVPLVIQGNKPIAVYQYNNSQGYDGVATDPFYITLSPVEQHQDNLLFSMLANDYPINYVNFVCDSADYPNVEIAMGPDGEWKRFQDVYGPDTLRFSTPIAGKHFVGKTFPVNGGLSYRLRGSAKMTAYVYAHSSYDSYGSPASSGTRTVLSTDLVSPKPVCTINNPCNGAGTVTVTDYPADQSVRSNLAQVYLDPLSSVNYSLLPDSAIVPGFSMKSTFKLKVVDSTKSATAVIIAVDAAGNVGQDSVRYIIPRYTVEAMDTSGSIVPVHDMVRLQYSLRNPESVNATGLRLSLEQAQPYFRLISPTGSFTINAGDTALVTVEFSNDTYTRDDTSYANLNVIGSCRTTLAGVLTATTVAPIIVVNDIRFDTIRTGTTQDRNATIRNTGNAPLTVTGMIGPVNPVFTVSSLPAFPFTIPAQGQLGYTVTFKPDVVIAYNDSIVFAHNGAYNMFKEVAYLDGVGKSTVGIGSTDILRLRCSVTPNPVSSRATLSYGVTEPNTVSVTIIDGYGSTVMRLVENERRQPGNYNLEFATDGLSIGAYFCRIRVGSCITVIPFIASGL